MGSQVYRAGGGALHICIPSAKSCSSGNIPKIGSIRGKDVDEGQVTRKEVGPAYPGDWPPRHLHSISRFKKNHRCHPCSQNGMPREWCDLPGTYFKSWPELRHGWDLGLSLPVVSASRIEKHVFLEEVSTCQEMTSHQGLWSKGQTWARGPCSGQRRLEQGPVWVMVQGKEN